MQQGEARLRRGTGWAPFYTRLLPRRIMVAKSACAGISWWRICHRPGTVVHGWRRAGALADTGITKQPVYGRPIECCGLAQAIVLLETIERLLGLRTEDPVYPPKVEPLVPKLLLSLPDLVS